MSMGKIPKPPPIAMTPAFQANRAQFLSKKVTQRQTVKLRMTSENQEAEARKEIQNVEVKKPESTPESTPETFLPNPKFSFDPSQSIKERGVSFDQDGKSNTWAIEPKMEVKMDNNDNGVNPLLVAGGASIGVVASVVAIVSNLPDPDSM